MGANPGTGAPKLQPARMETGKAMIIAGLHGHFSAGNWGGIPELWQRFADQLPVTGQVSRFTYGLCTQLPDGVDYLAGVEVAASAVLPAGFKQVNIPAQKYAVFEHRGHVSKLRDTLDQIWRESIPASGLRVAAPAAGAPNFFERYGANFDPQTGMGGVEVWIPIQG